MVPDQVRHSAGRVLTLDNPLFPSTFQINMVFDELLAGKEHNGPVLFVEEDHYVSPSFYQDLMKLHQVKHRFVHIVLELVELFGLFGLVF